MASSTAGAPAAVRWAAVPSRSPAWAYIVSAEIFSADARFFSTSADGLCSPRSIWLKYGFEIFAMSASWRSERLAISRWPRMKSPTPRQIASASSFFATALHVQAAVDRVDGPRDVAGLVLEQKLHDARHFFRLAEPALRDLLDHRVERGLGDLTDHLGLDETGRDGVDRDAAARHLQREALGEPEQPGFGRRVIRLADVARLADDRADVDDAPGTALDHVLDHALDHAERAEQVDVEHVAPVVVRHLAHRLVDGDAGVVDQEVDAPEALEHFGDDALAVFRLVDAALMHRHLAALAFELALERFGGFLTLAVPGSDAHAVFRQHRRDRAADSAGAAGDQRNVSVKHRDPSDGRYRRGRSSCLPRRPRTEGFSRGRRKVRWNHGC